MPNITLNKTLTDLIKKELNSQYEGDIDQPLEINLSNRKYGTKLEEIVKRIVNKAINGDTEAINLILPVVTGDSQNDNKATNP